MSHKDDITNLLDSEYAEIENISQKTDTIIITSHLKRSISTSLNISPTSLFRWLQPVHFPAPERLPQTLSIDEFKGDANKGECQCNFTDLIHQQPHQGHQKNWLRFSQLRSFPKTYPARCQSLKKSSGVPPG